MNRWVVVMLGFAFVIAADKSLLPGVRRTPHGQTNCQNEFMEAIGAIVNSSSTKSDGSVSNVSRTWGGKAKKKIVCTLTIWTGGAISSTIDGKTFITK